jgi:hypothetical protein
MTTALQIGCSQPVVAPVETPDAPEMGASLAHAGYRSYAFTSPVDIPDDDATGVRIGPLELSGTGTLADGIVLSLDIVHAYAGDLRLELQYDADHDGACDASSPIELHLARVEGLESDELWACQVELDGVYLFKDEGWRAAGAEASFEVFEGLPDGGSFYLVAVDDAPGDVGVIRGWVVLLPIRDGDMAANRFAGAAGVHQAQLTR